MTLAELEAMPPGSTVKLTACAAVPTPHPFRGGMSYHRPGPIDADFALMLSDRFDDDETADQFLAALERM